MPRPVPAAALAVLAALAGAVRADEPPAPTPTAAAPAAPAATPVPEPETPADEATRSEPDTGATPAGTAGGHRKGGAAAPASAPRPTPLYTVLAFEAGKSLSVRSPDGHTLVFGLTKKTKAPAGLAAGATVTVRARTSGKTKVATEVRLAEPPAPPAASAPPTPPAN